VTLALTSPFLLSSPPPPQPRLIVRPAIAARQREIHARFIGRAKHRLRAGARHWVDAVPPWWIDYPPDAGSNAQPRTRFTAFRGGAALGTCVAIGSGMSSPPGGWGSTGGSRHGFQRSSYLRRHRRRPLLGCRHGVRRRERSDPRHDAERNAGGRWEVRDLQGP